MNKEVTPHVIWKSLLIVAALGMLCLALFGCNPVKRVLNNPKYYNPIADHVISSGLCVNDSIYISDTTILLDTLYNIETVTDTVTVGDSVWIDRVEYRTIKKTVTIRDTTVVTDNSRINLLQKELIKKDGELIAKNDELAKSKSETKEVRKERNKWRLYFFLLLGGIGTLIGLLIGWKIKTGALKLISPIKL